MKPTRLFVVVAVLFVAAAVSAATLGLPSAYVAQRPTILSDDLTYLRVVVPDRGCYDLFQLRGQFGPSAVTAVGPFYCDRADHTPTGGR